MRGATISLRSLRPFSLTENAFDDSETPRTVVTPCASHSLYGYSASGFFGGPPPWTCRSTNPGSTYMPVASTSWSASNGGRRFPVVTSLISVIRWLTATMSTGPRGPAPVPSTRMPPRITSLRNGPFPSPGRRSGAGRSSSLSSCANAGGAACAANPSMPAPASPAPPSSRKRRRSIAKSSAAMSSPQPSSSLCAMAPAWMISFGLCSVAGSSSGLPSTATTSAE